METLKQEFDFEMLQKKAELERKEAILGMRIIFSKVKGFKEYIIEYTNELIKQEKELFNKEVERLTIQFEKIKLMLNQHLKRSWF